MVESCHLSVISLIEGPKVWASFCRPLARASGILRERNFQLATFNELESSRAETRSRERKRQPDRKESACESGVSQVLRLFARLSI